MRGVKYSDQWKNITKNWQDWQPIVEALIGAKIVKSSSGCFAFHPEGVCKAWMPASLKHEDVRLSEEQIINQLVDDLLFGCFVGKAL